MNVLPLYLPHKGCSHQCVYCNQPLIVGPKETPERWRGRLESFSANPRGEWEIAFFGGTFSALAMEDMRECFQFIAPYTRRMGMRGVRISTRPDRVSEATLSFLQSAGVRTIELGVESLDDAVLRKSARGHAAEETRAACLRIRRFGFHLGLHLMCGLPGQSAISFYQTVQEVAVLHPDFVRIAPTLVLKDTPLEKLYQHGDYQPLSLESAIGQCMESFRVFHRAGISIARMGLAISDEWGDGSEKLVAGPWHPALRHEVESRLVRETIRERIYREEMGNCLFIHPKDVSIVVGEGRKNITYWKQTTGISIDLVRDENQPRHTARSLLGVSFSLFDPVEETNP